MKIHPHFDGFTRFLVSLPPLTRRLFLIFVDAVLLPLAVWLSFWFRLATLSILVLFPVVGLSRPYCLLAAALCIHRSLQRLDPLRR